MLLFISVTAIGREWIRPVLWCFCIGGIIQAVLAIGQYFSQKPLGLFFLGELKALHQAGTIPTLNGSRWVFDHLFDSCIDVTFLRRASGTLNHSNLLASFLLVSIFSSFALFKTKTPARQLQILAICISLMIFALILTFSRSAFFGGIFGAFLYFYHIKSPSVLRWIAGISFVFSCILLSEQILQRGGIFNYNDFSSGSDAIRIAQNKVALKMFAAHPFLGVGYQQFTYTPEWNDFSAKEAIAMVHNSILLVAAETGLFAAICLMGFFFFILKSGWRTSSELEAAGLAIAAAFCLIANSDFYPFVCQPAKMALFLFLGLIPRTVRFCEFGGPAGPLNPVARPKGRLW
jgi:O-antigen ligase